MVAKVEHHPGELFPRVGFIVTNLTLPSRAVVRFYNKRGTAEQWIKEGKQAVKMTRLSCHRFRSNEVRLWLTIIAYNLGNLWRRLVLPQRIGNWSLTSLQQRLVKTGGTARKTRALLLVASGGEPSDSTAARRDGSNGWRFCGYPAVRQRQWATKAINEAVSEGEVLNQPPENEAFGGLVSPGVGSPASREGKPVSEQEETRLHLRPPGV